MTTTAYFDPATRDLYVLAGDVWHGFLGPWGLHTLVDDTVVPDLLELMVPLMAVRRENTTRRLLCRSCAEGHHLGCTWDENSPPNRCRCGCPPVVEVLDVA